MRRRAFLSSLLAGAGALALDPERALWVPGRKLISVPAPRVFESGAAMMAYWGYVDRGPVCEYQRAYNAFVSAQIEIIQAGMGWTL